MLKTVIFILCIPFLFCSDNLDEKMKSFLDKYSSNYTIGESTSNFAFTLEKKTEYTSKKKTQLKSKISFKNKYNQTVFQRIEFFVFQYETETKCNAAIDSLLRCFPTECSKVTRDKDMKAFKVTPSIFILNKKSIIVGNTACEQLNENWDGFKSELIKTFAESESKKITTGCGGPLEWQK